ncbi:MAG TPA: hypothetical protein V6C72_04090 [Chroococcales cyanobacterium]
MIPLGTLGQIYTVCAAIGILFIAVNVFLGQLDDAGSGDGLGGHIDSSGGDGVPVVDIGHAAAHPQFAHDLGKVVLSLLSPMTIATFLAFFGLAGLTVAYTWPWLGIVTLVPALGTALGLSFCFRKLLALMMRHMHTSSHAKTTDLIGQVAEVNIPMHDGRQGEVTYVIHSKRINHSARPTKGDMDIAKGTKVLIVQVKDHMVLVEPYDPLLENHFAVSDS